VRLPSTVTIGLRSVGVPCPRWVIRSAIAPIPTRIVSSITQRSVVSACQAFSELVRATAVELLGEDQVPLLGEPVMGAEDFSYVLQQVPGAMAFVGARPADQDPATAPVNHSNRVIFDEPAMAIGAATYVAVALRSLAAS